MTNPGFDLKRRILVTGANGMVGSALVRELERRGASALLTPRSSEMNLLDEAAVNSYFEKHRPEFVFLVAAKVGGIGASSIDQVGFTAENVRMQLNALEACHRYGTAKNLFLGSSCIYPRDCPQPMREEYLLTGQLEPTNEGYALAKILGLRLAKYYELERGMTTVCAIPSNVYGTNDTFDLSRAHVVAALIRRLVEAEEGGKTSVQLWGTGGARRELTHVDDVARALVFLMSEVGTSDHVNVGTGEDVTIRELAEMIRSLVGFRGGIEWDSSRPDGMPRKVMDVSRLTSLGFRAAIGLSEGLGRTVEEYMQQRAAGAVA